MLLLGHNMGSLIFSVKFYQIMLTLFKCQFILTTARFFCSGLTWHKISLLQVHLVRQYSDFKSIQICPKLQRDSLSANLTPLQLDECKGSQENPRVSAVVPFCCPHLVLVSSLGSPHAPQMWPGNEPFFIQVSTGPAPFSMICLMTSRNNGTPLVHLTTPSLYFCKSHRVLHRRYRHMLSHPCFFPWLQEQHKASLVCSEPSRLCFSFSRPLVMPKSVSKLFALVFCPPRKEATFRDCSLTKLSNWRRLQDASNWRLGFREKIWKRRLSNNIKRD